MDDSTKMITGNMDSDSTFQPVQDLLDRLTTDEKGLPGAAVMAIDAKGNTIYEQYAGKISSQPDATAMAKDSVFWLTSCTKLITSIAAMQCVERSLLALDDSVGAIIPECAHPEILTGFGEDGQPLLKPTEGPMTLRQMLCHSSGLGSRFINPELQKWSKVTARTEEELSGIIEGIPNYPLLYEPGYGWAYGGGLDWAGVMIERVSGLPLDEYFQTHIFKPLGLENTTFIQPAPEKIVSFYIHQPDGSLKLTPHPPSPHPNKFSGGAGLWGTASDYIRIVAELAKGGGVLLQPATVEEMFRPQLGDTQYIHAALRKWCAGESAVIAPNFKDPEMRLQHGLSFFINVDDLGTGRRAGAAEHAGAANTYWWADREAGVVGVVFAQLFPFGDDRALELYDTFEKAVYACVTGRSIDQTGDTRSAL